MITQKTVIKAKCMDCTNQQRGEVVRCQIQSCPLWCFRIKGTKPREGTPEYEEFLVLCEQEEHLKQLRRENMTDKQKEQIERWKQNRSWN